MASVCSLEVPPKLLKLVTRAQQGKASPKDAIKVMCYSCMGFEGGRCKTVQAEVEHCTSNTCPLYPYRPRSKLA